MHSFTPLIRSLAAMLGAHPFMVDLDTFRYRLSGGICHDTGLFDTLLSAYVRKPGHPLPGATNAVPTAEPAAHGRDFHLQLAVVVPSPLDAGAVNHPVFAEQPSRFIPLAADAM
jgi:hypothetical protein